MPPIAPLHRRDDVVFLKESALLGKLESYKIISLKQTQDGRWVYQVDIGKKPPDRGLIGDSFDGRIQESSIYFTEIDFVSLCEALDIITSRLTRQIASLQQRMAARCEESDAPVLTVGQPRWGIGDDVHFAASARLGFIQKAKVTEIHEVGVQPGSKITRYQYRLSNDRRRHLLFREDELITFCEAAQLALESLQRDLVSSEAKRASLCPSI